MRAGGSIPPTDSELPRLTDILRAIERRFGFVPPFFLPASDQPDVLTNLWHQTLTAYVDNPLPDLFKEKLSAYLSRYCAVPYCLVCHACALRPMGMRGTEILTLLQSPVPSDAEIAEHLALSQLAPLSNFPAPGDPTEDNLLLLAGCIYLERPLASKSRELLRHWLGDADFNRLILLISYVKTCHEWVEAHPEVAYELDGRYQGHFRDLAEEAPGLPQFISEHVQHAREARQQRTAEDALHLAEQRASEAQRVADLAEEQRLKLQDALRENEIRYQLAMLATSNAVWDWDFAANQIAWNESVHVIFGYTSAEVEASVSWWHGNIHVEDRERVTTGIRAVIDGSGHFWKDEYRFQRRDGSYAHVNDRGYIDRDTMTGQAVRMVGAIQDVTERVRLLEAERQARAQAEAASRVRDDLVAIVSHDLRNPLSSILTASQLLRQRVSRLVPESMPALEGLKEVDIIGRSAKRMNTLIDDLLDVTAIEGGGFTVARAMHDVGAIVRESVELLQVIARNKEVDLRAHVPERALLASVDRERLMQVLSNLLGNAIKFTLSGGSISAQVEPTANGVAISIVDTGVGISADELPHLFDRFWQANKAGRRGIGLGLFIVKGIIDAHEGQLSVVSTPGCGSTFVVTLPTVQVAQPLG